jgi:hypothetical protein
MHKYLLTSILLFGGFFYATAQDTTVIAATLPTDHRMSMISFSYKSGVNSDGYGLSYYRFPKHNYKGWYFPFSFSVENISVKAGNISQLNFQTSPLNFFLPGIAACKNFSDNVWFNFGLQIPISSEQLQDVYGKPVTHPIIGLAPLQQVYIVPRSTYGIFFAIGIYERITNAYSFKDDVGVRAEIGLKF